jgi:NtrC-family two-component system sensor histidine kinase KinB
MSPPPLRRRVRNGTLLLPTIALVLGGLAIPKIYHLSYAIRDTLYRNYLSIEAAQHMQKALDATQLAERDGTLTAVLPGERRTFMNRIDVVQHDLTEVGEAELVQDVADRGRALFVDLAANGRVRDDRFSLLRSRLDDLISINRAAMFRADSRANSLGTRLTSEFVVGLILLLIVGFALSWTLAWAISKPLDRLADRLRSFGLRGSQVRLGEQKFAELDAVAREFDRLADRLRKFDRLNLERLMYEKAKTEAIIASLEDGLMLINASGIVTHVNEVAALILGVEREDALGSPFDDLNSNHSHYLRVRSALAGARFDSQQNHRIEVDLHLRGRDHAYLLKPIALRGRENQLLGTLLVLQDITFLRDKDRARANLVATLSHELRTPLTSLMLSAQLLALRAEDLDSKQREMIESITDDIGRMRTLADNLLDLVRGESAAITVLNEPLDVAQMIRRTLKTFAIQAEQKQIKLESSVTGNRLEVRGDPSKLSWVLSNLIGNALRYTPSDGAISVCAEYDRDAVRLKVRDNGPGIAPEVRDHIFERVAQWDSDGLKAGTAGLGLSIVKDIVDAHGGRIFVDSSSRGTEFEVKLPAVGSGSSSTNF